MSNDPCNTCQSPLEAALIAQDLAALDSEAIRVQSIIDSQCHLIDKLEKENGCLKHDLNCCEKDKSIITSRVRATVGKLQGIRGCRP